MTACGSIKVDTDDWSHIDGSEAAQGVDYRNLDARRIDETVPAKAHTDSVDPSGAMLDCGYHSHYRKMSSAHHGLDLIEISVRSGVAINATLDLMELAMRRMTVGWPLALDLSKSGGLQSGARGEIA